MITLSSRTPTRVVSLLAASGLIVAGLVGAGGGAAGAVPLPGPADVVALATSADPSGSSTAVNDNGLVVGFEDSFPDRGFAYDLATQTVTQLPTLPGGDYFDPDAVNDNGLIVGDSRFSSSTSDWQATAYDMTTHMITGLGLLAGYNRSFARAVNDSGLIVGEVQDTSSPGFPELPVSFDPVAHTVTPLGGIPAGWDDVSINDVNNAGIAVGEGEAPDGHDHAVAFDIAAGTMTDLGVPAGSTDSVATTIDASGRVAGYVIGGSPATRHLFFSTTSPNTMTVVPLPSVITGAHNLEVGQGNDNGLVAATLDDSSAHRHAFVYDIGDAQWVDLGTLSGLTGARATAVNDANVVVGSGSLENDPPLAWIPQATPVTTTTTTTITPTTATPTTVTPASTTPTTTMPASPPTTVDSGRQQATPASAVSGEPDYTG